jgi:hypothetical protein
LKDKTSRRNFLLSTGALGATTLLHAQSPAPATPNTDVRGEWLKHLQRVSDPVLLALSRRELRKKMPVEAAAGVEEQRRVGTHLEALGRLLCGIAPWLELDAAAGESPSETALRDRYRTWCREAIASAVDPTSPDFMNFGQSPQTLVDSSFLALALLRAPKQLLHALDAKTKERLAEALVKERVVTPGHNNWLLFAAMNEAALKALDHDWDKLRVDYALASHQNWYLGDGTYGDGPHYHADFYNSFVIQPYLLQLMETIGGDLPAWEALRQPIHLRAQRYAAIQERTIGPAGHFPPIGRSIAYRCGAFHLLADVAKREILPHGVLAPQVRDALTAVMRVTLGTPETFTPDGWLRIGLAGHQPSLGETYISTGSLYLCSAAWLPLGLPASNPFWSLPPEPWSAKKIWAGTDVPADHAQDT